MQTAGAPERWQQKKVMSKDKANPRTASTYRIEGMEEKGQLRQSSLGMSNGRDAEKVWNSKLC